MQTKSTTSISADTVSRFRLERNVAFFSLLLLYATWPLWWGNSNFPAVPLFQFLCDVPVWVDRGLTGLLVGSLFTIVLFPLKLNLKQYAWFSVAILFLLLCLLNQHRIQTWVYQFSLMGLLFTCTATDKNETSQNGATNSCLQLIRYLVASIYIFSALSKLDLHFISGGGYFLLNGLLDLVGLDDSTWPSWFTQCAISFLPLFELAVGIGLLISRFRFYALIGSLLLHLGLLAILGPWGLNHSLGVLLWNIYFLAQNIHLWRTSTQSTFSTDQIPPNTKPTPSRLGIKNRIAKTIVVLAISLPLLSPFGYFDHWPSWAVYTSSQERFIILVDVPSDEQTPPELAAYLAKPQPLETRQYLQINQWSLDELHVPVYPQSRFQWGVLRAVQKKYPELEFEIIIEEATSKFSTKRQREEFATPDSLRAIPKRFWLNSQPRNW